MNFKIEKIIMNSLTTTDLKFADVITLQNGERYVFADGYMCGEGEDYEFDCCKIDDFYDHNFNVLDDGYEKDIVKVERNGVLIYERKPKKAKEMTVSEISKALGYEVKIIKETK